MKKLVLSAIAFWTIYTVKGQTDSSISLNQLQVPSTPAFTILGVSPNDIERPKNPTDFAVSLSNASQNFTVIPKSYAAEVAPFWILGGKSARYKDFEEDKPGKNILQTAVFSIGTTTSHSEVDSSEFYQIGMALKFSIFRGSLTDEFKHWNDSLHQYLGAYAMTTNRLYDYLISNDKAYNALRDSINVLGDLIRANPNNSALNSQLASLTNRMTDRSAALYQQANDPGTKDSTINQIKADAKTSLDILTHLVAQTDFKRIGWKWDFALGMVLDYPDQTFENAYLSKLAAWTTFGYESEKGWSVLGLVRGTGDFFHQKLNDNNVLVNDINIGEIDYGLRIYDDVTPKLTLSVEAIWRKPIYSKSKLSDNNISAPQATNRYVFTASYKVGKNQNLAFTYGKNFDNSFIKKSPGDMIAALSLIMGFGSTRPFGGSSN